MPLAHSQSTSNPLDQMNSGSSIDCSDPANAASSACNGTQMNPPAGQGSRNYGSSGLPELNRQSVTSPLNNKTYTDNGGLLNGRQMANRNQRYQYSQPQPLTEFQKYVSATTGQVLPIFGANLFQNVPSTFAPVEQVPVTSDYILGPGDELRIRVWGSVNFNADVRVDRSGSVYLPQIGAVHVAGLPFSDLKAHLRAEIGRVFRNFNLTVDMGQLRSIQVFVVGQARRPGSYTVSSLSTLVNALFASGGPSVEGSFRHILLKRQGKTVTDFDFYDLLLNGDKSKDVPLLPGDVIFIPAAGPQVALTGSVRRPAIYELRDQTSVKELLALAGGTSAVAADSRISIDRVADHQDRQTMEVSFDAAGLATTLSDGDVLRVLSIVPRFAKTITLRGNTANPGHFAWHEGMRLSDLIPDRQSLITRNYWWRRSLLGLPGPEFEPYASGPIESQPANPVDLQNLPCQYPQRNLPGTQQTPGAAAERRPCPERQSGRYEQYGPYGQNNQYDQYGSQYGNQSELYGQYPANGQMGANEPYPPTGLNGANSAAGAAALTLGAANGQQVRNDRSTVLSANQEGSNGSLASQQGQIITQNVAGATTRTDVKLSAPEIDWNYAVIERMNPETLKTSLIPFNLGKLVMGHDPTQDLALQPGDVVTVFSQADIRVPTAQQTKFVRLEGEFVSAGIYSVRPGETLRQLVARAGGLTPDAYLYGSEFTRESTRVLQQQRISEYVQSLSLQIERGGVAQASSATSGAADLAGASAAMANERELIARLEKIRATGRIVLQISPNAKGIRELPGLPLEDGDRFIVPSVPASVNVVGAVYDQNSFVFKKGTRIGDYLHMAGGPNRDADKKHMFVIRADGSVISRDGASGLWGNTFYATYINPGDTLVVPEKTFRPSALRGFIEWSQLFSQLALGSAYLTVIP